MFTIPLYIQFASKVNSRVNNDKGWFQCQGWEKQWKERRPQNKKRKKKGRLTRNATRKVLVVDVLFFSLSLTHSSCIDPVCHPRDFSIPRANFRENVSRMPVGLHNCRFKGYNSARPRIPRDERRGPLLPKMEKEREGETFCVTLWIFSFFIYIYIKKGRGISTNKITLIEGVKPLCALLS